MWYYLLCCTRWFKLLSLWMKPKCVTIQMKAIEQCFHVVLFIVLYKVVQTFKFVDVYLLVVRCVLSDMLLSRRGT